MAGHPVELVVVYYDRSIDVMFNRAQSVPHKKVEHALDVLRRAELLPPRTESILTRERITVRVPRPSSVPSSLNSSQLQNWMDEIIVSVERMTIEIQNKSSDDKLWRRVLEEILEMEPS